MRFRVAEQNQLDGRNEFIIDVMEGELRLHVIRVYEDKDQFLVRKYRLLTTGQVFDEKNLITINTVGTVDNRVIHWDASEADISEEELDGLCSVIPQYADLWNLSRDPRLASWKAKPFTRYFKVKDTSN